MPLVVPGMQSNDNSKTSDWMNKLTGKKIGDASNETVRVLKPTLKWGNCLELPVYKLRQFILTPPVSQTFAKNDLPKQHRVVKDGDMMTMDHNPERYVACGDDCLTRSFMQRKDGR